MNRTTRVIVAIVLACGAVAVVDTQQNVTRYVRYSHGSTVSHGILEDQAIRELEGDLFASPKPSGRTVKLSEVTLLTPLDPSRVTKVLGVAGNYQRPDAEPRKMAHPRWFAKLPTSINRHDGNIEIYPESKNLDWEGELVLVIGKRGRHISVADAPNHIFGVTVGNDVSENTWYGEPSQRKAEEPSRLLSKAADTWAVLGQAIVAGIDYSNLEIKIWQNRTLVGQGRTSQMINPPAQLVSYLSRYVTLMPGDLIYTGTVPPTTDNPPALAAGDMVEVDIENVGRIRNKVVPVKIPRASPSGPQRRP